MKRVWAIASIAIRNALRSRVIMILLIMLLMTVVALPLTIKGDGTVAGYVRILIGYTLGATSFLLSLATLWAGAAAVSVEVEEKQIQLIVTKPVRRSEIWMGKWLGLTIINFFLLTVCGVTAYGIMMWNLRQGRLSPSERQVLAREILTAQDRLLAPLPDLGEKAREEVKRRRATGDLPLNLSEETIVGAVEQALLKQSYGVAPSGKHVWTYTLPCPSDGRHPLFLRYRFSTSSIGGISVKGEWQVGTRSQPDRFRKTVVHSPGPSVSMEIPADSVALQPNEREVVVTYINQDTEGVTVLFEPADGVEMFIHYGGFLANYARALLITFCQVSFLAAIGVTAGSLFSLPVAAFLALFVLILIGMGGMLQSVSAQGSLFYRTLFHLVRMLQMDNPYEWVASGVNIPWLTVMKAWLAKGIIYTLLTGALGVKVFAQRELAQASS